MPFEEVVAEPDRSAPLLPVLTDAERKQVLYDWNETEAAYPQDQCIHLLFEEQAVLCPSHTALISGEEHITYGEMLTQVKRLAALLSSHGVSPDVSVALLLQRSAKTAIAIYGVLRAGGFYVPMDVEWPADRVKTITQDCCPRAIVTTVDYKHKIPPDYKGIVLCMDDLPQDPPADPRPRASQPSSSAVVCFYTSGTTGEPKGVVLEHRALVKRDQWFQDQYPLSPEERVINKAPYTFSVSVWEYFWTLSHGATLVVASAEEHKRPDALHSLIVREEVSRSFFVPSMLKAFLTYLQSAGLSGSSSMTHMFTCGEALTPDHCRRFFEFFDARLINLYGPTEGDITFWECPRLSPGETMDRTPVGKPTSNAKVYILDSDMQPVPVGVSGELHIGGPAIARGYLNRPSLTQEKFIKNPFAEGRLFKTGDLGRHRSDGNIEFLGRIDHQVKIRGFRIELGEIESTLLKHEDVQSNVVVVHETESGGKRLLAYVVPENRGDKEAVAASDLRDFLEKRLPEYMIPPLFIFLPAIPLTPNGKIDRKALPLPAPNRPKLEQGYVAPRTAVEKRLAKTWEDLLVISRIGIHDNFFDLGGNSLLVVELASRIKTQFDQDLPLQAISQFPTIAEIGVFLRGGDLDPTELLIEYYKSKSHERHIFWIVGRFKRGEIPIIPLKTYWDQAPTKEVTGKGIEEMASEHVEQMRKYQKHGPYDLGGYSSGSLIALEAARQFRESGEEVSCLFMIDPLLSFEEPDRSRSFPMTVAHRDLRHIRGAGVRNGMRCVWSALQDLSSMTFSRLTCMLHFELGMPLPNRSRKWHLERMYWHAESTYRPREFSGTVKIYLHNDAYKRRKSAWQNLCPDARIEMIDTKNHRATMYSSHKNRWLADIAEALSPNDK